MKDCSKQDCSGDSSEEDWKGVCPHEVDIKMRCVINQQTEKRQLQISVCTLKVIRRNI